MIVNRNIVYYKMKRYALHQTGITKKPAMFIVAENKKEAWEKVYMAGIKNKSKLLELKEILGVIILSSVPSNT